MVKMMATMTVNGKDDNDDDNDGLMVKVTTSMTINGKDNDNDDDDDNGGHW